MQTAFNRHVPLSRHRNWRTCLAVLAFAAVAASPSVAEPEPAVSTAESRPMPDPDIMRKWARSCALCHVDGNGGAPRIGHAGEWQPRLAKGRDLLLQHTVSGFNKMPPLGYCMSCDAEDFRALIDFMAGVTQ